MNNTLKPLVISGNVPSQKNGKMIAINRRTGKPFVRSNDRVKAWQTSALYELKAQVAPVIENYPIDVLLVFYFDNKRRHDLDNCAAGVMDILVKAEILPDDSVTYVDCLCLQYGGIDKGSPRSEVFINS